MLKPFRENLRQNVRENFSWAKPIFWNEKITKSFTQVFTEGFQHTFPQKLSQTFSRQLSRAIFTKLFTHIFTEVFTEVFREVFVEVFTRVVRTSSSEIYINHISRSVKGGILSFHYFSQQAPALWLMGPHGHGPGERFFALNCSCSVQTHTRAGL